MALALERLSVPVMVMIRPRGGDFLYTSAEVDAMLRDIEAAGELGAPGVVFGMLASDGTVDRELSARLIAAARPMEVTFHRAFDLSRDLVESLDALLELGVDRVLTSCGQASVTDGLATLAALVERAGDELTVMPGGGIREENVERVLGVRGVREVHIGARRHRPSAMTHHVRGVPMGSAYEPDEYLVEVTDTDRVAGVARRLRTSTT